MITHPVILSDPLLGLLMMPERLIVSPVSASVSFAKTSTEPVLSSFIVSVSLFAIGAAVFQQSIATVVVARFDVPPLASIA